MLSTASRGNQSSPPQSDSLFHLFAVGAHANPTTCPRAGNMQMNGERASDAFMHGWNTPDRGRREGEVFGGFGRQPAPAVTQHRSFG